MSQGKADESTGQGSESAHGSHFDVTAPTSHGEDLREHSEVHDHTWKAELKTLIKAVNDLIAKAAGAKKEDEAAKRLAFLAHPLLLAAVVTAFSTLAIHYFQSEEAVNKRTHEFYKTKLDFATTFGDSFPLALNLLYRNTRAGLWLDHHAADGEEPAAGAAPEKAAAYQRFVAEYTRFEDTRKEMLGAKQTTTLCAQAAILFEQTASRPLDRLKELVKSIQNVRDDDKAPYDAKLSELNELHDEANIRFTEVLDMLGASLRSGNITHSPSQGVSGEVKAHR